MEGRTQSARCKRLKARQRAGSSVLVPRQTFPQALSESRHSNRKAWKATPSSHPSLPRLLPLPESLSVQRSSLLWPVRLPKRTPPGARRSYLRKPGKYLQFPCLSTPAQALALLSPQPLPPPLNSPPWHTRGTAAHPEGQPRLPYAPGIRKLQFPSHPTLHIS